MKSSIIKGTFSLTLSTVIVKMLGLIYKIPLAALLGDEGMGYFNSAYTVYAFFYLICTAGVPKAVMILTSEARATGEEGLERKIVRVSGRAFLIFGLAVSMAFIIMADPLAKMIGNSKAAFTMIAIAPSIAFISLAGVIRGYLTAKMRMLDIAVSQVLEGVGRLAFGLCFAMLAVRLDMPLQIASAFTILGVTLGAFAGLVYLIVCSKYWKIRYKAGQKANSSEKTPIIKRLLSISVPITLSAAAMSVTNIIDLILIMRGLQNAGYSQSDATALYGNYTTLAVPMFNLAVSLLTPVSIAFIPYFTESAVKRDNAMLFESIKGALRFSSILAAPLTLGMAIYAKEALYVLFPSSSVEEGAGLLCMLSPAIIFSSILLIINSTLEATGKPKAPIISMISGSAVKLIIGYILISRTQMGISGAPIGTVACYGASALASMIIFVRHTKKIPPVLSTCVLPYLNAALSVISSKIVYNLIFERTSGILSLFVAIITAALLYLGLSIFTGVIKPSKSKKIGNIIQIYR